MFTNFKLDNVKLIDPCFVRRRELVKQYVADFDIDRLMHTFRINAGIASNAEPLGGWEDVGCGLRGHFVGHYLSACSRFAFADKDERLKAKATEIVDIMEQCAKPSGYLSAFEEEKLDVLELEENRNVWAPYYTLHKIMQGLIDCHIYLRSSKALKLALKLAHYIHGRFQKLSYWKIDGMLRCTKVNPVNEFGGIGDSLYTLYELTGDKSMLELARIFDRDYWIDPLASGRDVLDNLHANTHLPMIIAAMHRYDITGEERYRTAAVNFYSFLQGRTFANGNNSSKATAFIVGGVSEKSEHWGGYGRLDDALTGGESESCCAHNSERILERLLEWTGDAQYAKHMESLKYNAVLNSASDRTGLSQYHQPMGNCAAKKFSGPYDSFWCCTGSGVEAMSELQKNIWFKSDEAVFLNSFISSSVRWEEKNVTITQQTRFPDSLSLTLVIEAVEPTAFKLMLRAEAVKGVFVNSVPVEWETECGYAVIQRIFQDGDTIGIEIEASLHLVPLQGDESRAAVMNGNVLLAGLAESRLPEGINDSNIGERFVRTSSDALEFVMDDRKGERISFVPLYRVEEETYTVYYDLHPTLPRSNGRFYFAQDGSAAYKET